MTPESELTSMTVSLPSSQKAYVKERAVKTGCSTPSEYIRRLIYADQQEQEQAELERKLLDGLDSPARELSDEDWMVVRETLRGRLQAEQRRASPSKRRKGRKKA